MITNLHHDVYPFTDLEFRSATQTGWSRWTLLFKRTETPRTLVALIVEDRRAIVDVRYISGPIQFSADVSDVNELIAKIPDDRLDGIPPWIRDWTPGRLETYKPEADAAAAEWYAENEPT